MLIVPARTPVADFESGLTYYRWRQPYRGMKAKEVKRSELIRN